MYSSSCEHSESGYRTRMTGGGESWWKQRRRWQNLRSPRPWVHIVIFWRDLGFASRCRFPRREKGRQATSEISMRSIAPEVWPLWVSTKWKTPLRQNRGAMSARSCRRCAASNVTSIIAHEHVRSKRGRSTSRSAWRSQPSDCSIIAGKLSRIIFKVVLSATFLNSLRAEGGKSCASRLSFILYLNFQYLRCYRLVIFFASIRNSCTPGTIVAPSPLSGPCITADCLNSWLRVLPFIGIVEFSDFLCMMISRHRRMCDLDTVLNSLWKNAKKSCKKKFELERLLEARIVVVK